MHLDVVLSLELNSDGSVSGTWKTFGLDSQVESHSDLVISTTTLRLIKDHFMAKDFVRLSRGINVMIDASALPRRAGHEYFHRHLQTEANNVVLDRLEQVVSRSDFQANFLDTRGGGPALYKVVIKYVPRLRELLTSK